MKPIVRGVVESTVALALFHSWLASLDGLDPMLRTQGAVLCSFLSGMWLARRAMGSTLLERLVALLVLSAPSTLIESFAPSPDRNAYACALVVTVGFSGATLALRALHAWNRVRARSLIWSLTHAQLVVIATMLALFIAAFAAHQFDSAFVRRLAVGLPGDAALAVRVVAGALPIVVVLTVGTAILLPLLLPPAFLFAWLAARGMTRRVEELVAVESMAKARRDLFARVSHELKNPLAALRAAVDGMRARNSPAPEIDVVDAGVERLTRLVGDLSELARAEVGRLALALEDVDLRPSIRAVVSEARLLAAPRQIALLAEIDEKAPLVRRLDRVRFEQILTNLLQNALTHVEAGGIVRVRAARARDRAVVVVEDTGGGIDAAALPRIFEPGFSRDGGLGLGLAVARELAERMGGSLAVEAASSAGATFTLRV